MRKISYLTVIAYAVSVLCGAAYALSLPDGVNIGENFIPGLGESLGEVLLMQGDVFVIHEDRPDTAFKLMKGIPLFRGDTVITGEDGKVSMELTDGSLVTLTTRSNVVISEHIFDEKDTKERASFISMNLGKARFFVRKLMGFDRSDFRVKTKTAIVGVRGSDFVVEAAETSTRVTTMENTLVEVVGLIAPCKNREDMKHPEECEMEPTVLTDFRQAVITADGRIDVVPGMLPQEQINMLRQEFIIRPDGEEFRKGREEEGFGKGILVSNDKLVPPDTVADADSSHAARPDVINIITGDRDILPGVSDEVRNDVSDDMPDREDDIIPDEIKELPDFPDYPK
ncbi:MAG: FecR domain-containing protein [Desulfococcaceae bacterium]